MSDKAVNIHPAADLFPMMTEEELQELAGDIKANGLIHPIIIDDQKQIVDGRNRLKACQMAGVKPVFEQLNGRDPLAYIVSANLERRNLTKGQQAMALAMIYPEPEKGGRGHKKERVDEKSTLFGAKRLQIARAVLRESRELAESVIKGILSLDDALAQVNEQRQQVDSAEAKLARLRASAPDLAAQVAEERLRLNEAIAVLQEREIELRRTKQAGHEAANKIIGFVVDVTSIVAAIEAGEDIRIAADTVLAIDRAYEVFKSHIDREAS